MRALGLLVFTSMALVAGRAMADPAASDPEPTQAVKLRPHPGYDPLGVRLGAFILSPTATAAFAHDDNIYASDLNRESDYVADVTAAFGLRHDVARLPVALRASATSRHYFDHSLENYVNWSGGASLGYDFGSQTSVAVDGGFERLHESRSDPTFPAQAIEPPSSSRAGGLLQLTHNFAYSQLQVSGEFRALDYQDARLANGGALDQDFRDRDELTYQAQFSVEVSPSLAPFLRAVHREQRYRYGDPSGLDRDSQSNALFTGAKLQITDLVNGELGVGALKVNNDDPGASDSTSLALTSKIEYYVTPLITATLTAQRTSEAADIADVPSYIGTDVQLAVDYEFRRNVILSATFADSERDYSGNLGTETGRVGAVQARWLVNRILKLDVGYSYEKRDRPAALGVPNFTRRLITIGVQLSL